MEKISIKQFCDIVGISDNDRFVLSKLFREEQNALKEWSDKLDGQYNFDSSRITLLISDKEKKEKKIS